MSQKIQTLQIKNFTGLEVRVNATNQPPGTLRCADGINVVPEGACSFGPAWGLAWNKSALGANIATALAGATASKVHFVLVTLASTTFLVAWNMTSNVPRGIFHVSGTGDPNFTSTSTVTITATNNSVYRDHADGLDWYATWVQDQLFLGNGTDTNLVWASSALAVLGPASTPTNAQDPSQVGFPPCKAFLVGPAGNVYASGNVTHPLRVWAGEIPNIDFPINRGTKTTDYSYLDLQVNATSVTALSNVGVDLIAHTNIGPPMILNGYKGGAGGWKSQQIPTEANAGAINPNCTRDTKVASLYLGTDLEFYRIATYKGSIVDRQYATGKWRKEDIVTDASAGAWNVDATKPISGSNYGLVFDTKNGRTWVWVAMSAGSRQGLYCYEERTKAITGPWRYPDFLSFCQLRDENLNGCLVCGITRDGVFLWADMAAIGEFTLPAYGTALPAACAGVLTPPTASPGLGYVGVDAVNSKFTFVLNGQTLYLADVWGSWSASGSVTPTVYYNDARVAIIEFADADLNSQAVQKEMIALRSSWDRNSIAYVGAYCQCNGYSYGGWRGLYYPSIDWLAALGGEGSTVRVRLVVVSFNSRNALLSGVGIDYLPSVPN